MKTLRQHPCVSLALILLGACGKADGTAQMPPQSSTIASEIDWLYYFLYWLSVVAFVAIMAAMIAFVWKYRKRPGHRAKPTGHNTPLELFWTFSPLAVLFLLFHWGFQGYVKGAVAPSDAIEIRVRGQQWNWEFEYPNGAVDSSGTLRVPVDQPVKLIMSSSDVIHSFFVPEFRVKRDVVPGMYSSLWFEATKQTPRAKGHDGQPIACKSDDECPENTGCVADYCGEYVQVFCTEYCGAPPGAAGNAGHSNMLARILVTTQEDYDKYMKEGPSMPSDCESQSNPQACWGERIYQQSQCNTCHNIDGVTMMPAPNFKGLWGRKEKMADGLVVDVDENYIRESILMPQAKKVAGYTNVVMPPYRFSDRQIDAVIAYIKTLTKE